MEKLVKYFQGIIMSEARRVHSGAAKRGNRGSAAMSGKQWRLSRVCICGNCGHIGKPADIPLGSLILGFCLCLMRLLPGLLYFIPTAPHWVPSCRGSGVATLVPISTPVGRELM